MNCWFEWKNEPDFKFLAGGRIQTNLSREKILFLFLFLFFFLAAQGKLFSFLCYPPALVQSRRILLMKCTFSFQRYFISALFLLASVMNTVKMKRKIPAPFIGPASGSSSCLPFWLWVGNMGFLWKDNLRRCWRRFSSLWKRSANILPGNDVIWSGQRQRPQKQSRVWKK